MKKINETVQVAASITETAAAEPQAWKTPTLTIWKVEIETLAKAISGSPDAGPA
jgi:hypothetical protein